MPKTTVSVISAVLWRLKTELKKKKKKGKKERKKKRKTEALAKAETETVKSDRHHKEEQTERTEKDS